MKETSLLVVKMKICICQVRKNKKPNHFFGILTFCSPNGKIEKAAPSARVIRHGIPHSESRIQLIHLCGGVVLTRLSIFLLVPFDFVF
jgi:hypothetical protein